MNDQIDLPEDMEIPESRKDTTVPHNVRWLLRNLFIRNSNHPEFEKVVKELKKCLT